MKEESAKITPVLQQYLDTKEKYKGYILFYRMGDFYEMFFDDAVNVSKELELTLTSRSGNPMCGVPHHSSEIYIKRLIDRGYKVAICEQVGAPSESKGLVKREVTRIVTAGTLIEDSMLVDGVNNFIACFFANETGIGFTFADLSTGEIHVFEKSGNDLVRNILAEISRYQPVEILFNKEFMSYHEISDFLKIKLSSCVGSLQEDPAFDINNSSIINEQLNISDEELLKISNMKLATRAIVALLRYFADTQKNSISRFTNVEIHNEQKYMSINLTTMRNLEITSTMRSNERKGSLMWVLDKTKTSMGRRKLRQYIERPLICPLEIRNRLDSVDFFVKNITVLGDLQEELSNIADLERLMTRIVYKTASPRDVYALGVACRNIPKIKALISETSVRLLKRLSNAIYELTDVESLVANAIMPEPPALTKDGNYINNGYNQELDKLRLYTSDNKAILQELEEGEKLRTGIKNLKVGYNRVFGYYIEVSKGNIGNVPANYIRKQTLTNGERYITEELKKIENEILGANDKILALEAEIFSEIKDYLTKKLPEVQSTAESLAILDVFCSFASAAIENNYRRPDISLESVIDIRNGRHPVVEKVLKGNVFTPNDAYLDLKDNRLLIITGPNMAGKSTFMRQVAIITLMAQLGSFVPASSARIGVVDKIFTRVGASDDLSTGQSTFMVEMNEVAEILENATDKSLVILDEIGRGTSTFDGISIAKAVAEYINSKAIGCKTLFATHYHELISLENTNKGIRNFSVAVSKNGDDIQFLHKIVEGGVDDSYGVEVAKLAGLPAKVINSAKSSLRAMEHNSKIELETEMRKIEEEKTQIDFSDIGKEKVITRLKNLDINNITPIDAMRELIEIKKGL